MKRQRQKQYLAKRRTLTRVISNRRVSLRRALRVVLSTAFIFYRSDAEDLSEIVDSLLPSHIRRP